MGNNDSHRGASVTQGKKTVIYYRQDPNTGQRVEISESDATRTYKPDPRIRGGKAEDPNPKNDQKKSLFSAHKIASDGEGKFASGNGWNTVEDGDKKDQYLKMLDNTVRIQQVKVLDGAVQTLGGGEKLNLGAGGGNPKFLGGDLPGRVEKDKERQIGVDRYVGGMSNGQLGEGQNSGYPAKNNFEKEYLNLTE